MMKKKIPNIDITYNKIPPQATDLEQAVLGIILNYGNHLNTIVNHFKPEYFYLEKHQFIAKAILLLHSKNINIDVLSVTNKLKTIDKLEECGGTYYLSLLQGRYNNPTNLKYNMLIIRQKYIYREIIARNHKTIEEAYDDRNEDVFEFIDKASERILSLRPEEEKKKDTTVVVSNAIQDIFLRAEGKIKSIWKTGYKEWDNTVSTSPGIMVFAGASGVGKTTFITFLMSRLLKNNKDVSIQWFTIDHETGNSIMRKFFSQSLHVEEKELTGKTGKLNQSTLDKLVALQDYYKEYDIEFIEKTDYIWNLGKEFKRFVKERDKGRLKIFLLDNLMKVKNKRGNKNEVSEENSVYLSELFNELRDQNVLLIILHHLTKEQLSKENVKEGFRPRRENLRNSGILDAIADQVILINRPGKYFEIKRLYDYEFLPHFVITDVAKSSFGVEKEIYWWSHLPYCIYDEIEELN